MTSTTTKSSCPDRTRKALCRNPFLSIKFFVFCHGLLQLSQLLVSSYLKSSISTIEKRYGLSSKTSGLLASFNEVGNTLLIVFISYFGSRVHRPRFIGCGAILVSLAGFLMSLPHFITGPYEYDQSVASRCSRKLYFMPFGTEKGNDILSRCQQLQAARGLTSGVLMSE
ncbi:hypothetical protein ASZ78_009365 [Callipepla squamata]|uniref:Major facilitator superfamily (MFS) profile domain-containing protein n=1 Tax=Callipepla squamata TaxID=9009 RepID=A0A226MDV5_CALSU|nr:hypothetical protein ASZ78_009365 [Callipepla squamata]